MVAAVIVPLSAVALTLLVHWPAIAAEPAAGDEPKPIAITPFERKEPVSFAKEILPVLSKNCLSCHNAAKAENKLVLETPQAMVKGGENGPAVVPGKSAESLLLKVAAHQVEPTMPPDDNNVDAKPLTSIELGLLAAWINQGAIGDAATQAVPVKWQALPTTVQPIYAVAASPEGQYAACTRGNQIFIYDLNNGQLTTQLADPELSKSGLYAEPGVAHFDLVQSLAFSPDGDRLASGAYREVKLWHRQRNVSTARWALPQDGTGSLALSPDGKWAAIGDAQGAINLWDLATGQVVKTLTGHTGPVTALRFKGADTLVSASADQSIRLWNLADGTPIGTIATPAAVTALAVLDDGKRIVSGSADNMVRVWRPEGNPADKDYAKAPGPWVNVLTLEGHKAPITALAGPAKDVKEAKDKNVIFSASADGSIRQWTLDAKNLDAGQQTREIAAGGPVACLAVRPDGQQLASVDGTHLVKLWKVADGQPWNGVDNKPLPDMKGDIRAAARGAAARRMVDFLTLQLADTKKAITDAEAKIASTAEMEKTAATAKETAVKAVAEKAEAVKPLAAAKEAADKNLATIAALLKTSQESATQYQQALEKDAANAELKTLAEAAKKLSDDTAERNKVADAAVQAAVAALTKGQKEAAAAEAASLAAERLASAAQTAHTRAVEALPALQAATTTSEARLAEATTKAATATQQAAALEAPLRSVAYSADGNQLAVGGDNKTVYTFSSSTGLALDSFEGHAAPVLAVAVAPGGSAVSIAADKGVIVWQPTASWQLERRIGNVDDPAILVDRVLALAFDPSGTLLATGGGEPSRSGELKLWNVADGQPVRTISPGHSDTVFGLDFSPDGTLLASGAADRIVKVFEVGSGALANSFEGHTHHVLDVAWRGDGKMLASAGADCVIKFWDYASGDQLRATPPGEKEVTSVAFIGASNKMIASWGDRVVRLYNSDTGAAERTLSGGADFLYSAAVTLDGKVVVAGGQDSKLLEWNLDDAKPAPVRKLEPLTPPAAKTAGK
jgi:predicted CXXCH cytochrome family protein